MQLIFISIIVISMVIHLMIGKENYCRGWRKSLKMWKASDKQVEFRIISSGGTEEIVIQY